MAKPNYDELALQIIITIGCFWIVFGGFFLWSFTENLSLPQSFIISFGSFAIFATVAGMSMNDKIAKQKQQELDTLSQMIVKHENALRKRHSQLAYVDDYGTLFTDRWDKEVEYFLSRLVFSDLKKLDKEVYRAEISKYSQIVNETLFPLEDEGVEQHHVKQMSGVDYEHFCADFLRESDWDVRVTQASGDQGIDLIATKNGLKVVFQCKYYSSPVGNAAVQEAAGGRLYEGADVACVVSNADYTRAARELASRTGVLLLHHSELTSLDRKLLAAE